MASCWGPLFSRDTASVSFECLRLCTISRVRAIDPGTAPVVSDLTLGAWVGNQTAHEWCGQLGIDLPEPRDPEFRFRYSSRDTLTYADTVGRLIDSETAGDRSVLMAIDSAERVISHIQESGPRNFIILTPRFGLPWEPENLLFLNIVGRPLVSSGSRLILGYDDRDDLVTPSDWQLTWDGIQDAEPAVKTTSRYLGVFPGTVEPQQHAFMPAADSNEQCLVLDRGYKLIEPASRKDPHSVSRLTFDEMALADGAPGWFIAYCQQFGNNGFVNSRKLMEEAQERFTEGGYGIAFRTLERAVVCARTPLDRAIAMAAAQGMRIAVHHFKEASAAPDPPPFAPPHLQRFLMQSKGWGLVMCGKAHEALSCFQAAMSQERFPGGEREQLYLENIAALAKARTGDLNGALAAEQSIGQSLASLPSRDWHLEYINNLNTARLYKRLANWTLARLYYEKAFASMEGGRSESDGLYVNVTLGQLSSESGDLEESRLAWLRASLHWVSLRTPEALAWRVSTTILGREVKPCEMVIEDVSNQLRSHLQLAYPNVRPAVGSVPVFCRATDEFPVYGAVGARGWGVLTSSVKVLPGSICPAYSRLRHLLVAILQEHSPHSDLERAASLAISDRHGCEMPKSEAELVETCLEFELKRMNYEGQRWLLDTKQILSDGQLRVEIAPIVNAVAHNHDQVEVQFKRYFRPIRVNSQDAKFLAFLEKNNGLQKIRSSELTTVRRLQRLRIVSTRLFWQSGTNEDDLAFASRQYD